MADSNQNKEEEKKIYEALPSALKKDFDANRNSSYTSFLYGEALKIAKVAKTELGVSLFEKSPISLQFKLLPNMSTDHSGATFRMSCHLARRIIKERKKDKEANKKMEKTVLKAMADRIKGKI